MQTRTPYIKSTSTLTDRYQTTVPKTVREALGLEKHDKIHYEVQPDKVVISREPAQAEDPVLNQFLTFLENDIRERPQHIHAIDSELLRRIRSLTKGMDVDLNSPLTDEDE